MKWKYVKLKRCLLFNDIHDLDECKIFNDMIGKERSTVLDREKL